METTILEKLIIDWNPHFEDVRNGAWKGTITREKYLKKLKELINIRHTVILTGVRRAGKSVIMQQLAGWLIEEQKVPPKKCCLSVFGRHKSEPISQPRGRSSGNALYLLS